MNELEDTYPCKDCVMKNNKTECDKFLSEKGYVETEEGDGCGRIASPQ